MCELCNYDKNNSSLACTYNIKLRYERQGQCNRCGDCCMNEDCLEFISGNPAICKIYDERPLRCRLFPDAPPIPKQLKQCGYWFIDTWEDNKTVKFKVT